VTTTDIAEVHDRSRDVNSCGACVPVVGRW